MTRAPQRPVPDARRAAAKPAINIDPVRVLREHWKVITYGTLVGAVFGVIFNFGMGAVYPIYSGEVVFEIRNRILEGTDATGADYQQEEQVVRIANTEISFMLQDPVLEAAMASPGFQATEYADYFKEYGAFNTNDCLRELKDDLGASFLRGTQVFVLRFSSPIQDDVAPVLNSVMTAYESRRKSEETGRIELGTGTMRTHAKELTTAINDIDEQIAKTLRGAKIQSYEEDPQKGQMVLEALLSRRAEVIQQVQLSNSRLEAARARQSGTGVGSEDEVREARMDNAVQALIVDRDRAQAAYDSIRARFRLGTPQEKEAADALDKLEQQLKSRVAEQVQRNRFADEKKYDDDVTALNQTLTRIESEIGETEAELVDRAAVMAGIERLKLEKEGKQESLKELEAQIASNELRSQRADAQQVIPRPAVPPKERVFPKLKITIPGGAALGMLSVLGVLFLREATEQRVRFPSDLAGAGKILGVIPVRADEPNGPTQPEWALWNHPNASFSEVMRQFAMEVSRLWGTNNDSGKPANAVMFVSAGPSGGTTTMVTNFAAASAHAARRTLIVDANFRRPRMHALVGLADDTPGLGELLQGRIDVETAIRPAVPGIDVVCAGAPASRLPELLCTVHTGEVFDQLQARYDVVVIDAPPLVVAGESLLIADRLADRTVLVVNAVTQEKGLVFRFVNKLREAKSEFIGVVLNRPVEVKGGHMKRNIGTIAAYAAAPEPGLATRHEAAPGTT